MTLTLPQCEDMIMHGLDASELPGEFSALDIVNRAGSWLYTVHPWSWLNRTGSVTATVSQNYVSLAALAPSQVHNVWWSQNLARFARRTTMDHINTIRSRNVSSAYPSWFAVNTREISGSVVMVLEFDFAFTTADVLTVQYQPSVVQPPAGNIMIPTEWEGIFIQAIRAYARGYQEQDTGELDVRMQRIAMSDEMNRLRRMDGMRQANMGPMRGGIGSMAFHPPPLPDPINIPH